MPVQGSGTFAVEAAVGTLVPRDGRLLVLVNGAYGRRIAAMARRLGRLGGVLEVAEDQAIDPDAVAAALAADPAITDVALVHCETTSGLLNPLAPIAAVVRAAGRRLIVDAMSSFGAVPIDGGRPVHRAGRLGQQGAGRRARPGLRHRRDRPPGGVRRQRGSLSLDLYDQWRGFEANGQWRFTPPVQVVAALAAALDQLEAEGGVAARHARYRPTATCWCGHARARLRPVPDAGAAGAGHRHLPHPGGRLVRVRALLRLPAARGVVIYPGKLTREPSFRIGCIGAIGPADMARALAAIDAFMAEHRPGSGCA